MSEIITFLVFLYKIKIYFFCVMLSNFLFFITTLNFLSIFVTCCNLWILIEMSMNKHILLIVLAIFVAMGAMAQQMV